MVFLYECACRCIFERDFPVGEAAPYVVGHCGRGSIGRRYYGPEALPSFGVTDPFRAYHLSPRKERAAQAQQREIGGPKDAFERRVLERQHGISYVGDDTSGMSAKARRGIEKYNDKHVGPTGEV